MSDIKVGDLVVIVKLNRCCGETRNLGRVYSVDAIGRSPTGWCGGCFASDTETAVWAHLAGGECSGWIQLWRLKRIPPLSELESEKKQEEIKA